jgi:methylthioribose-1-phosphate isomerase
MYKTVEWIDKKGIGKLRLLDQTKLPQKVTYIETNDLEEIFQAILRLSVRGAPAIGCAAALGLAAVALKFESDFFQKLSQAAEYLKSSRPTAVNLEWAIDRCLSKITSTSSPELAKQLLVSEAKLILDEDVALCQAIGKNGQSLFSKNGTTVLTHCNAGSLAAGGMGTALAPIYAAHALEKTVSVISDETRPLLQGSRLTAWELKQAGIPVTVICDNMAAQVLREGKVDFIIVGADRIAANGDTANKIGTYGLAILAKFHNIPFYVAAPYSTFDFNLKSGKLIPIEQRNPHEIGHGFGRQTAPDGVDYYNPAFDVTPVELITGFITEKALITPSQLNRES